MEEILTNDQPVFLKGTRSLVRKAGEAKRTVGTGTTMEYIKNALSAHEKILFRGRKHPIVLVRSCAFNIVLMIIIGIFATAAGRSEPRLLAPLLTLWIFPICLFLLSYFSWHEEEFYLTTHRVIHSSGIIGKRVSDSSLEKVNDVVLLQSWLGRILDFGDVEILTASDIGANMFPMMRAPVQFKTAMLNQKEKLDGAENALDLAIGTKPKEGIYELISSLERLRREGAVTDEEFSEKKSQLLAHL